MSGSPSSPMIDPTSVLGRWVAQAQAFAKAPFDQNTGWLDFVLIVIITTTIAFMWEKILANHLPDIPKG
jgi:hypothetical protein